MTLKCAHDACGCEVTQTSMKYCSSYCESQVNGAAADDMDGDCGCGHADCEMGASVLPGKEDMFRSL